jgi:hypothetical protein
MDQRSNHVTKSGDVFLFVGFPVFLERQRGMHSSPSINRTFKSNPTIKAVRNSAYDAEEAILIASKTRTV